MWGTHAWWVCLALSHRTPFSDFLLDRVQWHLLEKPHRIQRWVRLHDCLVMHFLESLWSQRWTTPSSEWAWLQVLSRNGKAEDLTSDHRPFGRDKRSFAEIKRIQEAGGWVRIYLKQILLPSGSCEHWFFIQ